VSKEVIYAATVADSKHYFPPFTCSVPACCTGARKLIYKMSTSGTAPPTNSGPTGMDSTIYDQTSESSNKYFMPTSTSNGIENYLFYVFAQNGPTDFAYGISPLFTYKLICGPLTTVVTQGTWIATYASNQDVQFYDFGAPTKPTEFLLPNFISSFPACPVVSMEFPTGTGLAVFKNTTDFWVVVPQDKLVDARYDFTVKVIADGGAFFTTSNFNLEVGCKYDTVSEHSTFNSLNNKVVNLDSSVVDIYTYPLPAGLFSYCVPA